MSVALYMDHYIEQAITTGLHTRRVDVFTAYEESTKKSGGTVRGLAFAEGRGFS